MFLPSHTWLNHLSISISLILSSDTQTYTQVWGDFKPPLLGSCGISDEEDCMQVQLILNLCISRIVSISLLFNLFSSMRDLLTAGQPLVINQSKRPIFKNQRLCDHAYAWCPHGRWFLKINREDETSSGTGNITPSDCFCGVFAYSIVGV